MSGKIIGRDREQAELNRLYQSPTSEFLAVYGRRRVGKTFLIRTFFRQSLTFQLTGLANANLQQQLFNFHTALKEYDKRDQDVPIPENWMEAFQQLKELLIRSKQKKKVIFIDELPWLDTPRSFFISALEHFWNSWAAGRDDILLIVCGSAASWMINKLINNRGGLHNRITGRMKIQPFTLQETEAFLQAKRVVWDRYQILQLYMVMGGIPYYLNEVQPGKSAIQVIDEVCFSEYGLLRTEYSNLYTSLFKYSAHHQAIVEALGMKAKGLTREEIVSYAKVPNGGGTTKVLQELEESGFIRKYSNMDKVQRDAIFQLSDFYTLFYFRFIKKADNNKVNYWKTTIDKPAHRTWSGYAFEQVCLAHQQQIRKALGIDGIECSTYAWRSRTITDGAQIDLVMDRRDRVINLFEIKFSIAPFVIDKKYDEALRHKIAAFRYETQTNKSVFLSLLTTYGLKENAYSGHVQNSLTMDCLFL
ncbi:MAG: ATP-binding protein [Chitinophagales bacterium]|nr:ATP-binding protein [Chitinophagales bacterium]